jgi:FlaA1/EpsC-like NDP-sugar epimerase
MHKPLVLLEILGFNLSVFHSIFENMVKFFGSLKSWQKTLVACVYDTLVTIIAFFLALASRYGSFDPEILSYKKFFQIVIINLVCQVFVFYFMGLYKGIWRYSSTTDLLRVIKASTIAVLSSFMCIFLYTRLDLIPRSLFFIQWAYLILGLGGGRLIYRIMRDFQLYNNLDPEGRKRILIIGAGAGGEHLCREIKKNNSLDLYIAGFIDDSPALRKKILHGIPVIGDTHGISACIREKNIEGVYIAIPSASSADIRRIYEVLKPCDIEIKVLPQMSELFDQQNAISCLQHLRIEDLLGREEVSISMNLLRGMISGKRVLVTGAGGSIGSEVCKQIAALSPKKLVAIDLSELNTYNLEQNLNQQYPNISLLALVGDIRDYKSMETLFTNERPELVLHAAAYKHVPIMEFNPYEAIRTNILGTRNIAELATKYETERFVLISTDKAVNPTNVMGCTKRIAELVVQNTQAQTSSVKFMTVRFGNVLGSSGSVIPLFRKQIEKGGPLTVTDPRITRYFMSIPEATKLVLLAGAMGSGGELFVLDMGQPVKIIDLAREMIELSGFDERTDIEIKITGLRPGEKLYEEPLCNTEEALPTTHEKVKINKARGINCGFEDQVNALVILENNHTREKFIDLMKKIVPEYTPFGVNCSRSELLNNIH